MKPDLSLEMQARRDSFKLTTDYERI